MIIYLFIVAIIFINLLVAILASTFEKAAKEGRVHFYHYIIGNLRKLEYDPDYGCLVVLPIFMNFLNIFFIFYCLGNKNNEEKIKAVSKIFVKVGYVPVLCVTLLCSTILNILVIPLCYIMNLVRIFVWFFKKKADGIVFFRWFFFGPIIMIYQFITDSKIVINYLIFGKKLVIEDERMLSNLSYVTLARLLMNIINKENEIVFKINDFLNLLNEENFVLEKKKSEEFIFEKNKTVANS